MHKQRIYIDTSVIGGCFDKEFSEWSDKLFDLIKTGKVIALISEVTTSEIEPAPIEIRNKLKELPAAFVEYIERTEEAEFLASKYIENNAISKKFQEDALHIALATINKADVLVSWNFKHIVNLKRIHLYNSINLMNDYQQIEIRTPREVVGDE
ncbi:MAG: type II toxin-antitoxin system VapC family toxin [Bacteroidota bacterium]|jgi:predicted nucleic acid-binding protein